MDFKLKAPCGNCPFRTDKPKQKGWLGRERAKEIYEALRNDKTFTCHKTINNDEQFCAGALILLEHEETVIQNNALVCITILIWLWIHLYLKQGLNSSNGIIKKPVIRLA